MSEIQIINPFSCVDPVCHGSSRRALAR